MTEAAVSKSKWRWLRILGSMIACTGILGGAAAAIYYINTTEPVATQVKSVRKSAALVETTTAERGDYSPQIEVLGTVSSLGSVQETCIQWIQARRLCTLQWLNHSGKQFKGILST